MSSAEAIMMKEVTLMASIAIKNIKIGEGIPKICVSITGANLAEIISQAERIVAKGPDLVEWRADFFKGVMNFEEVEEALCKIARQLNGIPLIFTFRTKAEGGEREIDIVRYIDLNMQVSSSGLADLIDLEVFTCGDSASEVIEQIHYSGRKVIASYHDFEQTPSQEEIIAIMQRMAKANADILKVAVMPRVKADVEILIDATRDMAEQTDKPLLALSMGELGRRTRLEAESFGSAITFASIGRASAPGQVEFAKLKKALQK